MAERAWQKGTPKLSSFGDTAGDKMFKFVSLPLIHAENKQYLLHLLLSWLKTPGILRLSGTESAADIPPKMDANFHDAEGIFFLWL